VVEVQRRWRKEFGTQPPTRVTITRLRDKFETDGTLKIVNNGRSGTPHSSADNESAATVKQAFTQSTEKSARQCTCTCETGDPKTRVHRILWRERWNQYVTRLLRAINENGSDCRMEFCVWYVHTCDERERLPGLIVCPDKAIFKLNGTVSGHNSVY
jgi:hypothetical protein